RSARADHDGGEARLERPELAARVELRLTPRRRLTVDWGAIGHGAEARARLEQPAGVAQAPRHVDLEHGGRRQLVRAREQPVGLDPSPVLEHREAATA